MKKLLTLITCTIMLVACNEKTQKETNTFHPERIRDTIFENVIRITDEDIVSNGTDYHFNVSIPTSAETPVIFVQGRVPLEILSGIYPEFPRLIVIVPNWNFYEETAKRLGNSINRAEITTSYVIYEFNRENEKQMKDSIVVMGDDLPEIKFKQKTK